MVEEGKLEITVRHSRRPSKIRVSDRELSFDRFGELPDALLLYILSFLSVDDAISTSLLSRRWRSLWKWMDNLDFPIQFGNSKRNSIQFIQRAIGLHEGLKIKRFCARFRYNSNYISYVDSWVHFALARKVEKLVLDLFCVENGAQPYVIPRIVYKCGSLRELEVNFCRFMSPPPCFYLSSLKKMVINNTVFAGETLKILVSGCPVLEELALVNCNRAQDLDVVVMNRSLKRMKIVEFPDEVEEGTEVKIYAPYLLHLELQCGDPRPYIIQDASSIVSARLDIKRIVTCLSFNNYNQKNYFKTMVNIMIGLHEVKALRLSGWCVQAMPTHEDIHGCLPTTLQQLKHLKLDVQLTKDELPGIVCLLRNSPALENLTIQLCRQAHIDKDIMEPTENGTTSLPNCGEDTFWDSHQAPFHCLKYNLEKVVVENFRGEENEIRFLTFLLRNSMALKSLVILVQLICFTGSSEAYVDHCSKVGRVSNKYLENIRKLMESRRSPHTEILFSGSQITCF